MQCRDKKFSQKEEGIWLLVIPFNNSTLFHAPYISFHDTLNGYIGEVSERSMALRGLLVSAFRVYLNMAILWTPGLGKTYFICCHHREHHFCFLPRFTYVDREGWSTSHFHLRQTR